MKIILLESMVIFGLGLSGWAYSTSGPVGNGGDAWQVATIGYGGLKAPKNIGEGYRRNTPIMYYAFDANFLDYFGTNGEAAVENAYAILNNLTNVSSYSANLSEFPLDTRHVNYQAQALGILDVKSFTLGIMVEQLGLANPVQYTWTLHDRYLLPGTACPAGEEYLVVQRNYDTISSPLNQVQYSPYVNNTLYSYAIVENCTGGNPLAVAAPYAVDPLADTYSPVAAYTEDYPGVDIDLIYWGDYYTGLTRDDVAGLRALMQTNNINYESPAVGSEILTTNVGSTIFVNDVDLSVLSASALTNSPTVLQGLFPGLLIASVITNYTVVCTPNVVSYLTNFIGAPVGSAPVFVVVTNGYDCAYQPVYTYSFANVITNSYTNTSTVQLQTTVLGNQIGAPVGSPFVTNTTSTSLTLTNVVSGSYFMIPAGDCGLNIVPGSGITNGVIMTTNVITTYTNTAGFVYSQSIVTTFYNLEFKANPVICGTVASGSGLYEGIENIKFVQANYDSLLGQFFQPITNDYTMYSVTNGQVQLQHFQRVVTTPDFLFSAEDMASGPAAAPNVNIQIRNINFDTANVLPGLAGPGTITTPTTILFDKVGPVYLNEGSDVLDGTPYFTDTPGADLTDLFYSWYFVWGSFDGTTNAPVVYPNGTSIAGLQTQVLIQISPASVPNGTNGVAYAPTTFSVTGGSYTPPYTWSATGLPTGLTVSSGGTLSGTPSQSGTNIVFTLTLTDSLSRSVEWNYPITIK